MGRKAERRSGGGAAATRAASPKVISFDHDDDGVALLVEATATRPARELEVLARGQRGPAGAAVLGEALDHHRARRHVDPERQRLGREHHLEQPGREALLHRLAEHGHHAGVVGGHAALEALEPFVVAEHGQVLVVEGLHPTLGHLADRRPLVGVRQTDTVAQHLAHGVVAGGSGEDEHDRRQHVVAVELVDHLGAQRAPGLAGEAPSPATGSGRSGRAGPGAPSGRSAGLRRPACRWRAEGAAAAVSSSSRRYTAKW